jgi:antitoxin CcdA
MRMNLAYDTQAPKKATNVSINSDLLAKAKALKINVSATLETALADIVATRQRRLWKEENRSAIEAYNQLVEEAGVAGDGMRSF